MVNLNTRFFHGKATRHCSRLQVSRKRWLRLWQTSSPRRPAPEQERPGLDQLRGLRENKGLALEVLARTVGISPSYLTMIETGERLPDLAIRRSLAWELGVAGWREAS